MRKTIFFLCVALLAGCSPKYTFQLDEHLGICGSKWAEAAGAAGLSYLEANVSSFLMPEKSDEEFASNKALALSSALPFYSANGFFPREIKIVGPEADHDRAVRYSETAFRRASEIGMKILVLGSGGSRKIPDGFSRDEAVRQFLDFLKRIAPAAEKYGVIVAIEPLQVSECNFINTVTEGADLARKTGSPNICVLADIFHMTRMNESPESIVAAADKLVHCHIAENEERTPPGVKGDDFAPYLKALKKIRYTGGMSFECSWKDVPTQLPEAAAYLRGQIQSVK